MPKARCACARAPAPPVAEPRLEQISVWGGASSGLPTVLGDGRLLPELRELPCAAAPAGLHLRGGVAVGLQGLQVSRFANFMATATLWRGVPAIRTGRGASTPEWKGRLAEKGETG